MTVKAFAFEVQSRLSKASGIDLKRSHVHEVLAALFGYASYAALTSQRVLAQHDGSVVIPIDVSDAEARASSLGYRPPWATLIATECARAAQGARLCVITLGAVLTDLGVETGYGEQRLRTDQELGGEDSAAAIRRSELDVDLMFAIELESTFLRESLNRMADANSAPAHLALAHLDEEILCQLSEDGRDGRYWADRQQSGRVLTGVELEWAKAYHRKQDLLSSKAKHLERAIGLGSIDAALTRLELEPNMENFELAARLAGPAHASRMGHLAVFFGREDDARKWLRIAAHQGDTGAMEGACVWA